MHGRLKVKTTAEQQEAKRKEREKKLKLYTGGTLKAFHKRAAAEYDEEAMEITGQLLSANPDFYSLWNFRREILLDMKEKKPEDEMHVLFQGELSFLEACLRINPKSYGSWHHRCFVMSTMPRPDWNKELQLCNKYLEYDERNFHCWDYRRFVVQKSNVTPQSEFEFTTNKISTNFSNFSSWHYRSKLLPKIHPDPKNWVGIKEDELLPEFELVQNAIFTDPNDQSAWFYHRWLLGKGEKPLEVSSVHVCREKRRITATLSKPAKVGLTCQIDVDVNSQPVSSSQWHNLGQFPYSQIWSLDIEPSNIDDLTIIMTVKLKTDQEETSEVLILVPDNQTDVAWQKVLSQKQGTRFASELSGSTTTILEQELEACQQLHELEPDNKWTLLTLVSLMRALDPLAHEAPTLAYIDKLITVDPDRTMYYHDLRSKFIIENKIESLTEEHNREINLSNNQLTSLHHLDYMTVLTSVDLSNNCLCSAKGLEMLQSVRTLKLNNNKLSDCKGLPKLPYLQELFICDNNICDVGSLAELALCPSLKHLHLKGNPLLEDERQVKELATLLPDVHIR